MLRTSQATSLTVATALRRGNNKDAVSAESGPSDEAGGGDAVDDTKYLTRDPRSAGKQESAAGECR